MSPFQRWLVLGSSVATAVTGAVYAWMKYLLEPAGPWAVINHPLEPWFLKAHVLVAPVMVFAFGLVAVDHVWKHFRQRVSVGRRSGITTAALFLPAVATGYLIQVVTHAGWLKALVVAHLATGTVHAVGILLHRTAVRRGTAPRKAPMGERRPSSGSEAPSAARAERPEASDEAPGRRGAWIGGARRSGDHAGRRGSGFSSGESVPGRPRRPGLAPPTMILPGTGRRADAPDLGPDSAGTSGRPSTRPPSATRPPMRIPRTPALGAALLLLAACAGTPALESPPASAAAGLPPAIHWVRNSAEHRAVFVQTYRAASERVREIAHGREADTWAVILDADETVLDNSTYQMRLARRGEAFSNETWNAWVREEAAAAQPGAARFIELVRALGGRVAIVTNRDEVVCDPTRRNLDALGIEVDVVLCQAEGERGKEGRFRAVREGRTPTGLPPLDVVMWLGDNIHDFPGLDQEVRLDPSGPYELFGRRWFLLPNPMYGSWEANPAG